MTRPSLLYLAHRIPYPPNKGDKIRSFHLLRFLAERYEVHLGTFVDDSADWKYVSALERMCTDVLAVPLSPRRQRLRSLAALFKGEPLSVSYYRSPELASWTRQKVYGEGIRRILSFSSPMAQYAPSNGARVRSVVDFVDVDSEKWRQYASRRRWPASWVYAREGERLLDFEKKIASESSASVFVTPDEARLFRLRANDASGAVHSIVNGVDTEYFDPGRAYENPYGDGGPVVAFTGMMDYWANVDAVEWFASTILPLVRRERPEVRFAIVGARPTPGVQRLGRLAGVEVTGKVPDVRPYLAHASAAVAPLRVARGIQNKILEALAMARPVVATSAAIEGLRLPEPLRENVSDDPLGIAERLLALLESPASYGGAGRAWVREHHDWAKTLAPIGDLIEGGAV